MKIRLRGQSVRFRLGQSEAAALGRGESVEESTQLPGGRLAFELRPGGEAVSVSFEAGVLSVRVPAGRLREWALSEAVGFTEDVAVGDGESLRVLVEKDFVCLDAADGEVDADAFPNPSATCGPDRPVKPALESMESV